MFLHNSFRNVFKKVKSIQNCKFKTNSCAILSKKLFKNYPVRSNSQLSETKLKHKDFNCKYKLSKCPQHFWPLIGDLNTLNTLPLFCSCRQCLWMQLKDKGTFVYFTNKCLLCLKFCRHIKRKYWLNVYTSTLKQNNWQGSHTSSTQTFC